MHIRIASWSSPEEMVLMRSAFATGKSAMSMTALQSLPVRGTISAPGHADWDVHFAWQSTG